MPKGRYRPLARCCPPNSVGDHSLDILIVEYRICLMSRAEIENLAPASAIATTTAEDFLLQTN